MDRRLQLLRDELGQLGRTGRLKHVVRYAGNNAKESGGNRAALSKSMLLTDDDSDEGSSSVSDDFDSDDGDEPSEDDNQQLLPLNQSSQNNSVQHQDSNRNDGLAVLGAACTERLRTIIGRDFPARSVPSALEAEAASHWSLVARLSRAYVGQASALRKLDAIVTSEEHQCFFVTGEPGIGKVIHFFFIFAVFFL